MNKFLVVFLLLFSFHTHAQTGYFPPNNGEWETVSPSSLGWCEDSIPQLLEFLDATNSKAFIVLKDGKIAIEAYFDTFTQDSLWYWASAGKSLTAFLVGLAQEQGYLDINEPSSNYLGTGWTSCTPEQEQAITILNQLTMTSGLDDTAFEADCTDPSCLVYLEDPGNRWAYHNAPYTLLDSVIENATGQGLNLFFLLNMGSQTGMSGAYIPIDYNNVFFSTPRVMARFGLLIDNQANWNGTQIMDNMSYFNSMITSSQDLNESYGYLWWLNGYDSFMYPGVQFPFPGPLLNDAPSEVVAALGKNGQIINIVDSQNLVVIRMGDVPDAPVFVPNDYNNDIWIHLNKIFCSTNSIQTIKSNLIRVYPNPSTDYIQIQSPQSGVKSVTCCTASGQKTALHVADSKYNVAHLESGIYTLHITLDSGEVAIERLVVE